MKHLRKFNENVEKISMDDIHDICQELEDEGFEIDITSYIQYNTILIQKDVAFKYSEVKEVLLRLREYLGSSWRNMYVRCSRYVPITLGFTDKDFDLCEPTEDSLTGIPTLFDDMFKRSSSKNLTNVPFKYIEIEFKIT